MEDVRGFFDWENICKMLPRFNLSEDIARAAKAQDEIAKARKNWAVK